MAEAAVINYLRSGGADGDDNDDFLDFCLLMCTNNEGVDPLKVRYEALGKMFEESLNTAKQIWTLQVCGRVEELPQTFDGW